MQKENQDGLVFSVGCRCFLFCMYFSANFKATPVQIYVSMVYEEENVPAMQGAEGSTAWKVWKRLYLLEISGRG